MLKNKRKHIFIFSLITFILLFSFMSCDKADEDPNQDITSSLDLSSSSGKQPAVYINGVLYIADGKGSHGEIEVLPEEYKEYGKITSVTSNDEMPDEELESRGLTIEDIVYVDSENIYAVYVLSDGKLYHFLRATIN